MFTTVLAQLGGMSYAIFIEYGWNDVEPVTYMVSAFYAAIGSLFFVTSKSDFEFGSAYDYFR